MPQHARFDAERMRDVLDHAVARLCPGWMRSEREDLVQGAMVRVLGILARGEQDAIRSSSYLWQAAHSALVDEIRRTSRRREVPLDQAHPLGPDALPAGAGGSPAEASHLGLEIRDCLERLAAPRRQAVTLHLYGFAAHEAARALGGGLKRMRNLTYRGLADLRRCLVSKGIRP